MSDLGGWHRHWVEAGPAGPAERLLQLLLIPASWVYGRLLQLRDLLYRWGLMSSYRAPVPVVSVGNLAVGGTGKTPMVDYLVKLLLRQGVKVAVVSRGYGGQVKGGSLVCAGNGPEIDPEVCGDEPYLLARRNPRAVILVDSRRARGVAAAVERFDAEMVILDDGFQHLAVARDLDIVLLDARRPLGNGHTLPAGRLRERPSALNRADLLILTRAEKSSFFADPAGRPVLQCRHVLGEEVRDLRGERRPLKELTAGRALAFAGIADPEGFFAGLRKQGLSLSGTVALADHVTYDRSTLQHLNEAASTAGADFLVTTEKDGVKLPAEAFAAPCYEVPMTVVFADPKPLEAALGRCLHGE
jgi:tetraacyldisaccharide 4'-kinase